MDGPVRNDAGRAVLVFPAAVPALRTKRISPLPEDVVRVAAFDRFGCNTNPRKRTSTV